MANEISLSARIGLETNGISVAALGSASLDMAGIDLVHATQLVSDAGWEVLDLGELATDECKAILLRHFAGTATVLVAIDVAGTQQIAKLRPGTVLLLQPSSGVTYYVTAHSGSATIEVAAAED